MCSQSNLFPSPRCQARPSLPLVYGRAREAVFGDCPIVGHQPSSPSATRTWDVRVLSEPVRKTGDGLCSNLESLFLKSSFNFWASHSRSKRLHQPEFINSPSILSVLFLSCSLPNHSLFCPPPLQNTMSGCILVEAN